MERAFNATKSKYWEDFKYVSDSYKERQKFLECFKKDNNIKGSVIMGGDGRINQPLEKKYHGKIYLYVDLQENPDLKDKVTKSVENGLNRLKQSSLISKKFTKECLDNEIVINLHEPNIGDYFESLKYSRASWNRFYKDGFFYLKIDSPNLKDETPEGFEEIKLSEFYRILEEKKEEEKSPLYHI